MHERDRSVLAMGGGVLAIVILAIVAVLVSLSVVMYRVFAKPLGVEGSDPLVDDLGQPLSVLLVAVCVLALHTLLLHLDMGERGVSNPEYQTTLQLVVTAPAGADPDAIVASIQSDLLTGYAYAQCLAPSEQRGMRRASCIVDTSVRNNVQRKVPRR